MNKKVEMENMREEDGDQGKDLEKWKVLQKNCRSLSEVVLKKLRFNEICI